MRRLMTRIATLAVVGFLLAGCSQTSLTRSRDGKVTLVVKRMDAKSALTVIKKMTEEDNETMKTVCGPGGLDLSWEDQETKPPTEVPLDRPFRTPFSDLAVGVSIAQGLVSVVKTTIGILPSYTIMLQGSCAKQS